MLRGAVPVFVDVRGDTLNLDERLLEQAVSSRTRAICAVHYAGVGCEMDAISAFAARHGLIVVEDAAQGSMAKYKNRALGSIGALGTLSFHETKNVISGEGGALLINDERFRERAEVIREKGTNRNAFFRGAVDKYTWVDVGSSYLPSEIVAAFLWAQLEEAESITARRMEIWQRYHTAFAPLEAKELVRRPIVPSDRVHNAHMFYILVRNLAERSRVISRLKERGYGSVFHYVPLHSSPAGRKFGRTATSMSVTESASDRLIRLPLWVGLPPAVVDSVVEIVEQTLRGA